MPFPSRWGIHAEIAGRPMVWGVLIINSITGNRVIGTVNFRGTLIPINGYWNESAKQISFDSPYATYSGNLTMFDDSTTRIRHLVLSGRVIMKPPSLLAGRNGTWVATTDTSLTGPAVSNSDLPPVGAFLTSNILHSGLER
ncbi:hypothetical protein BTA37_27500 [Priestia megaterium]|uniref:hypothetical protein n=2 Tax=Priestia megaterium TaxID=1404 RepID=UPI00094C45D8|nr:hypothetical protein [Priestia megaterium]OLO26670.1 hypothetical protein BTA37_27500 [Priestia megaterium]